MVQIIDAPVPQTGEQLVDILQLWCRLIDVPKISEDIIQSRLVDRDLRCQQMAEQLVVPTVLSFVSLQQQMAEQIADIPAARGRVRRRGDLHGFHTGQGSTAPLGAEQNVDIPVLRRGGRGGSGGGLQTLLAEQDSTAVVEQIFDIPVPVEGLPGFRPGQGPASSSSSHSSAGVLDDENEQFQGVFSHLFPTYSLLPVKRAGGKKSDRRRVWHFMERRRLPRKRRDPKQRSVVDFTYNHEGAGSGVWLKPWFSSSSAQPSRPENPSRWPNWEPKKKEVRSAALVRKKGKKKCEGHLAGGCRSRRGHQLMGGGRALELVQAGDSAAIHGGGELPMTSSSMWSAMGVGGAASWTGLDSGTAGGWSLKTGPGSASTSGGPRWRLGLDGGPPGHGGIKRLAAVLPRSRSRSRPWPVVSVSVIMQLKFQHSFEFVIVPLIQFIVRVLEISACRRDRYAQCQTVQKTGDSTAQFLGMLMTCQSLCNDWCWVWSRQCQNRGGAAVAACRQPSTLLWRRGKSRRTSCSDVRMSPRWLTVVSHRGLGGAGVASDPAHTHRTSRHASETTTTIQLGRLRF